MKFEMKKISNLHLPLLFMFFNLLLFSVNAQECQNYSVSIDEVEPAYFDEDAHIINVCKNGNVSLTAYGDYPNNGTTYTQSDENLWWSWTVISEGDTTVIENIGLNVFNYEFVNSAGYYILLSTTDTNNCTYDYPNIIKVQVSVPPQVSIYPSDTVVCLGDAVLLESEVSEGQWQSFVSLAEGEYVCIEDNTYEDLMFFSFVAGVETEIIESVDDIDSLMICLEHSYAGDMNITLTCPNGQTMNIFEYYTCNNAYFGEPIHSDDCQSGVGYDYYWSPEAEYYITDVCNSGSSISQGTYLPIETFENLIGCPVNGDWSLMFYDNWGADDGTYFNAQIFLADTVFSFNEMESWNTIGISQEDLIWFGSGVGISSEGEALAYPISSGNQVFTLNIIDDWGCTYSDSVTINVLENSDSYCGNFCSEETVSEANDTINDGSGDDYPSQNNADCSWLINPAGKSDNVIVLSNDYFELYQDDFLYIYDGDSDMSSLLGVYTFGAEMPASLTTTGNTAYIKYVTNEYGRSPGWSIIYETILVDNPSFEVEEIMVFPNPANDILSISGLTAVADLYIVDIAGKTIQIVNDFENGNIDISCLESGVYFLKVSDNKNLNVFKFIKN